MDAKVKNNRRNVDNDIDDSVEAWRGIDVELKREGRHLVLPGEPEPMSLEAAAYVVERLRKDEAQEYEVIEWIKGAPWDAVVAIYKAMQRIYGIVSAVDTRSWFGDVQPDLITVVTGHRPRDRVQVPLGEMELPNVTKKVRLGMEARGAYLAGKVTKKDKQILIEIMTLAREIMSTESIFKGKAIRLGVNDENQLDVAVQPEFLNLEAVTEGSAIHTESTEALIQTNIYAPLKFTEACRKHKIPLKRGILLEGVYGTGKSLTALVTAKVATDHRWTFIMLDRASSLGTALEFAKQYQPCCVFAEDIDRVAEDRDDEDVNHLINLMDGFTSKTVEIMTILTTNFVKNIDKSLLRPGRFDAVITLAPPDVPTVKRLIKAFARDLIVNEHDVDQASEIMAGRTPAIIREVVERAKLSMLTYDRRTLTAEDLRVSADGMVRHLMLTEEDETPVEDRDLLWEAMGALIRKNVGRRDEDQEANFEALKGLVKKVGRDVQRTGQIAEVTGAVVAGSAIRALISERK
jgi:hypothetical protein